MRIYIWWLTISTQNNVRSQRQVIIIIANHFKLNKQGGLETYSWRLLPRSVAAKNYSSLTRTRLQLATLRSRLQVCILQWHYFDSSKTKFAVTKLLSGLAAIMNICGCERADLKLCRHKPFLQLLVTSCFNKNNNNNNNLLLLLLSVLSLSNISQLQTL